MRAYQYGSFLPKDDIIVTAKKGSHQRKLIVGGFLCGDRYLYRAKSFRGAWVAITPPISSCEMFQRTWSEQCDAVVNLVHEYDFARLAELADAKLGTACFLGPGNYNSAYRSKSGTIALGLEEDDSNVRWHQP